MAWLALLTLLYLLLNIVQLLFLSQIKVRPVLSGTLHQSGPLQALKPDFNSGTGSCGEASRSLAGRMLVGCPCPLPVSGSAYSWWPGD